MQSYSRTFVSAVAAIALVGSASAQGQSGPIGGLLGGLGGGLRGAVGQVGGTVGGVTGQVGGTIGGAVGTVGGALSSSGVGLAGGALDPLRNSPSRDRFLTGPVSLDQVSASYDVANASEADIENYRLARLRALINANRAVLDGDPNGQPVRKRELIASNPDPVSLSLAIRAGFRVIGDEQESGLGIRMVTLAIPQGMNVRQALKVVHRAAPALKCDYNHVYEPSGGSLLPVAGVAIAASRPVRGATFRSVTRIAMIDGGVASHPSLARASIEQRGFAGDAQPTGHGTAVGSLLVGDQGPFRGAARGAQLFVGDVYGGNPAAGSVSSIVRALSWAASKRPSVVNISLVGPNNAALAQAIAALQRQGIQVVAAVGNDGPAAPIQYPASYPGVIAVTGVDSKDRALPEAGKSAHLDFAAPGADMAAAYPGQGYVIVRGTSFASPLAAARLALAGSYQRLVLEARPGRGKVGRGVVCADCRTDPNSLRSK
jgi:hypothetical protein